VKRIHPPKFVIRQILSFQIGKEGNSSQIYADNELTALYERKEQPEALTNMLPDIHTHYSTLDTLETATFPPICTIWGEQNRVLSAKAGRELNKTLKPVREEYLPDCGHLCMLEKVDEVYEIIENFIDMK
jgi:pimeloyl-ACP methyl ester carboxylesterase